MALVHALLMVSVFLTLAALYPFVVYPAVLRTFRERPVRRGAAASNGGERFSLLFCAYNEKPSVQAKAADLVALKARLPQLEVLAFDDASTDGTAEALQALAPFVTVIRGQHRDGKAHGMKLLAARASREFLVFTDANVLVDAAAFDELAACYADPNVGGVCGTLKYLGDGASATAHVGGLYWRLEESIKQLESRTGNVMGADGSIFSVRSALYPDFADDVLDDFTVSMEVVLAGFRLVSSTKVAAYEHLVADPSEEFARKVRIGRRAFHTHRTLAKRLRQLPLRDRFKYVSHKYLRWWSGGLFIGAAGALLVALCLIDWRSTALVAVTTGIAGYWIERGSLGPLSMLAEVARALIATQLGVVQAILHGSVSTWEPAKSR